MRSFVYTRVELTILGCIVPSAWLTIENVNINLHSFKNTLTVRVFNFQLISIASQGRTLMNCIFKESVSFAYLKVERSKFDQSTFPICINSFHFLLLLTKFPSLITDFFNTQLKIMPINLISFNFLTFLPFRTFFIRADFHFLLLKTKREKKSIDGREKGWIYLQ